MDTNLSDKIYRVNAKVFQKRIDDCEKARHYLCIEFSRRNAMPSDTPTTVPVELVLIEAHAAIWAPVAAEIV